MAKKKAEGGSKKKKKKQYVVFRLQSESLDKDPGEVDDSLVCEVEPGKELPPVAELLGAVQRRLMEGDQGALDLLEAWRVWMREWAVELLRAAERSNEDIDHDPAKLTGLAFGILGYRRAIGAHIGEQSGPTWVQGYTGPTVAGWPVTLLLFLKRLVVTVPPPGETESGSAGTQPDKG